MNKVPTLRFKEFSGEWKHKYLNQVVERITRKNKGLISTLPLTISAQYGLVDQETFFNKTVASKNLEGYYLLKNGEFAYNKSYSNGYPWGAIKRLDKYECGVLSSLYICFKPYSGIHSDFLTSYFETTKWHKEVSMVAVEGARNHGLLNIAVSDFFETIHYIPTIEEQEKIASFFSLIDKKIELQTEKVEELKKYKKGIMQKIFSQELRFKDENGNEYPEWEEKRLGEFCYIQGGYAFKSDEFVDSGVPIIRITNVDAIVNVLKNQTVYSKVKNIEEKFWVRNGDLLIAMSGATTGKTGKYICDELAYLNQRVGKFVVKEGTNFYYTFLYAIVETSLFYQQLMSSLVAGAQPNISPKDIEEIKFKIPSIDEQKKISELLIIIDQKIEIEQEKLKYLNQYKKGLLQQMFI